MSRRAFNIAVAQNDPDHVMFFEVYDNAAARDLHRATEHFKTYQAATKDMWSSATPGSFCRSP